MIILLLIIILATQLITFYKLNKRIMTAEEKLAEYAAEINTETTRIADLIQELINQAQAGTLDLNELVAGLQPSVDGLKAVGRS